MVRIAVMTDPLDHPVVLACESVAFGLITGGVAQPSAIEKTIDGRLANWPSLVPSATMSAVTQGPFRLLVIEEVLTRAALVRCVRSWLAQGMTSAPGGAVSLSGPVEQVAAALFVQCGAVAGAMVENTYRNFSDHAVRPSLEWRDLSEEELLDLDWRFREVVELTLPEVDQ